MIDYRVSGTTNPAFGDLRIRGLGDCIWVHPSARKRPDWGRLVEAIACAVSRGAEVRNIVRTPEETARNDWKATQR